MYHDLIIDNINVVTNKTLKDLKDMEKGKAPVA
jgi:hypothetical protein